MERDYGKEIDALQKQLTEIQMMLQQNVKSTTGPQEQEVPLKNIHPMHNMHPDQKLSEKMDELCSMTDRSNYTGMITYLGLFSSGGRQSNWIRNGVNTDNLLTLIDDHTAEKVLHCIGNSDRLNILLAILKQPMSVAELVSTCKLNTTGQAYHHMKPLMAADLIIEDVNNKGVYIVQPHKVQGIIMLLAGISDMVDETYTKGTWDETE